MQARPTSRLITIPHIFTTFPLFLILFKTPPTINTTTIHGSLDPSYLKPNNHVWCMSWWWHPLQLESHRTPTTLHYITFVFEDLNPPPPRRIFLPSFHPSHDQQVISRQLGFRSVSTRLSVCMRGELTNVCSRSMKGGGRREQRIEYRNLEKKSVFASETERNNRIINKQQTYQIVQCVLRLLCIYYPRTYANTM